MLLRILGGALVAAGLTVAGAAYAEGQSGQQPGQAGQNAAFCMQSGTGGLNCSFASIDACNQQKKGSDVCIQNPARGTTGSPPAGSPGSRPVAPSTPSR